MFKNIEFGGIGKEEGIIVREDRGFRLCFGTLFTRKHGGTTGI